MRATKTRRVVQRRQDFIIIFEKLQIIIMVANRKFVYLMAIDVSKTFELCFKNFMPS